MDKSAFRVEYSSKQKSLKGVAKSLQRHLEAGVDRLQEAGLLSVSTLNVFRIRKIETRVKGAESLYDKINNDPDLKFEKAFEPGHVRDLVGGRIVCHNLKDVVAIGNAFRQQRWEPLIHAQRSGEIKEYIVKPQESGYRGLHFDVKWRMGRSSKCQFAEVQVRTLLQDAWASFVHDDVYKTRLKVLLGPNALAQFRHVSDLLYSVDKMAEELRKFVESDRLYVFTNLLMIDAINHHLTAMADFAKKGLDGPKYDHVRRVDSYLVDGTDGVFRFEFRGHCPEPEYLSFPVAGDTLAKNCEWKEITRFSRGQEIALSPTEVVVRPDPEYSHTLFVRDSSRKRKVHHYRLECQWKGVFEEPQFEYVWAPWSDVYPAAEVDYRLEVEFVDEPSLPPRLFDLSRSRSVLGAIREFPKGKGNEPSRVEEVRGRLRYVFEPKKGGRNFLCLFQTKR